MFCFELGADSTFVCYVATIGYVVFALPLSSTAHKNEFDLLLGQLFHTQFKPLPLVLDDLGVDDATVILVYSLVWTASDVTPDRVTIHITGAEESVRPTGGGSAGSSGDVPVGPDDFDLLGALVAMDEEVDSVCPTDDSDEDSVSEESTEESLSSDSDGIQRKPPGVHVYYTNGYFTFTDNASYPDIKCHVMTKWCTKAYMGDTNKSKTLVPSHFGDSRESPTRTKLVLRAWMLHKAATKDFANGRSSRCKLFAAEAASLRSDIVAMSSEKNMTTSNNHADELIASWAPLVLRPSAIAGKIV
jgi:hypothetical protein